MSPIDFNKFIEAFNDEELKTVLGCVEPLEGIKTIIYAHWKLWDDNTNTYECSNCGELWTLNAGTPEENNMNYCPKCGAKMIGDKNETD